MWTIFDIMLSLILSAVGFILIGSLVTLSLCRSSHEADLEIQKLLARQRLDQQRKLFKAELNILEFPKDRKFSLPIIYKRPL